MRAKQSNFSFSRVENTVVEPYARRLLEYDYFPGLLTTAFYTDERGFKRPFSLFEFTAHSPDSRVVFLVAKLWYRLKIQNGSERLFLSPNYMSPLKWEAPFLYFFNDDRPIYEKKETAAQARARRRAEDKETEVG